MSRGFFCLLFFSPFELNVLADLLGPRRDACPDPSSGKLFGEPSYRAQQPQEGTLEHDLCGIREHGGKLKVSICQCPRHFDCSRKNIKLHGTMMNFKPDRREDMQ